jgi:hypothetical protein
VPPGPPLLPGFPLPPASAVNLQSVKETVASQLIALSAMDVVPAGTLVARMSSPEIAAFTMLFAVAGREPTSTTE